MKPDDLSSPPLPSKIKYSNGRGGRGVRGFRILSQSLFFALFLGLFLFTVFPFPLRFPVDLFLRLDPLIALASMVAARVFIATMAAGFVLLALSFFLGRFFCGWVCPLGAINDFSGRVLSGRRGAGETSEPKADRRIKYFVLTVILFAALAGVNWTYPLSPLSLLPRAMATALFPPMVALVNTGIDLVRPLLSTVGLDNAAQLSFRSIGFAGGFASFLILFAIIAANAWRSRFFCRAVCPTGALISLFSRYGAFKRVHDPDACNDCGRCQKACPTRAISPDGRTTLLSECTLCGDCVPACSKGANRIAFTALGFSGHEASLSAGRRGFLASAATGVAAGAVLATAPRTAPAANGMLIRPPGSIPETEFLARCVRCGECMKVCKTNGLQPCGLEAGVEGIFTPRLVSRVGGCEEKCNLCGHVCPTRAVRALPLEEKRFVKMGTGVIDRHRCIAWEQDKLCLICDEICPTDAIEFKIASNGATTMKRPFVLEDKCTGCGLCETKCPTAGRGAIEVFSMGEERKKSGSYITEEKKKLREVKENDESGYGAEQLGSDGSGETDLPPGFSVKP